MRRYWTQQEIEYLKKNYSKMTNKGLVSYLRVSLTSLRSMAGKLKLKKEKTTLSKCYLGVSSQRMKENNPMNNDEIIEKMKATRKETLSKLDKHWSSIDIDNKKDFIIENYNSGLTLRQVGELIGVSANTIKRRMIKWGIPRRTECKYSTFHKSQDGHIVKSSMELECDNWLFENRIPHIYEKRLGETRFLCDFYIPEANLYIEIFGLTDDIYKERFQRKLEVYNQLGLKDNLIIILPKDKIQDKLRFLLSWSKVQEGLNKYEK